MSSPIEFTKRKQNSLRDNELKNYLCYEQAVIIALVNQFCSITIQKASKDSIITETAPVISEIIFEINIKIFFFFQSFFLFDFFCRISK